MRGLATIPRERSGQGVWFPFFDGSRLQPMSASREMDLPASARMRVRPSARILIVLFGFILLCPQGLWARSLLDARRALERERFIQAITTAQPFLASPRIVEEREARLITSEAMIGLGRFSEAVAALAPMLGDRSPGPSDAPWVRLLARSLQGQGLLLEAADWWLTYATFGWSEQREGQANLRQLLDAGLSQPEIAYLLWKHPRHGLLCPAVEAYIEREAETGHPREAFRAWKAAAATCRGEDDAAQNGMPIWLQDPRVRQPAYDFYTIGVLAPLNGRYARFGIAMANGADVSQRLHNAHARFPIRLEIADTGGSPRGCLEAIARLYERGIRVFVGELFSHHTLMASAYLHERNAVLISPAATDSCVGLMGSGTYTCTVSAFEQMAALAEFASDSLGVRSLALLWPDTPQGGRWARLFGRAASEQGARVLLDEPFPPGTTDFISLLEQTEGVVPDSIDALFCSGGMRELVALLSQLAHSGFLGAFIGLATMGEELVVEIVKEFGLLALYPGDTFVAAQIGGERPGFEETYLRLFGEEPDDFAQRGWTAFGLVGSAIEAGGYCPEALRGILDASSEPALRRGEGRRAKVPSEVGAAAVYLRMGDCLRLAGRSAGPRNRVGPEALAEPDNEALSE